MNLVEWNPFRDFDRVRDELAHQLSFAAPRVDVYEQEREYLVTAELPGVNRNDLEVVVGENALRLSGEIKRSGEYKGENIHRAERYYGRFSRVIPFATEVQPDGAQADYHDGILTVKVPKAESTNARERRLDIH